MYISSKVDIEKEIIADIVVVGGGAAGVAAAYAAANAGYHTLLIEQNGFLGGAAVAGLSGTFCGLYYGTDDDTIKPIKLPRVAKYFIEKMTDFEGITSPQKYGKTYTVTHDPLKWSEVAETILLESDVNIMYHAKVINVNREDNTLKGVLVSYKGGFITIKAQRFVDASGDSELIFKGKFSYTVGDNGVVQNPTMIFRLANVDMEAYFQYWGDDTISPDKVTKLLSDMNGKDGYLLPRNKIWIFDTPNQNELLVNATMVLGPNGENLNSLRYEDYTYAEIMGRKQVRSYERFLKEYIPGCKMSYVSSTGAEVGIRQTRTSACEYRLLVNDVITHKKDEDGIARVSWPIELHAGEKPRLEWIIDDYYEIPFKCLIPKEAENVIVAGRNLDAEHVALASARVTIPCLQMGEAAGLAAAKSIKDKCRIRDIKGRDLHQLMNY